MAKKCCLCYEKIGFGDYSKVFFQEENEKYYLCDTCRIMEVRLDTEQINEKTEEAIRRGKELLATNNYESCIKSLLEQKIKQAEYKLPKYLVQKQEEENRKQEQIENQKKMQQKNDENRMSLQYQNLITTGFGFEGYKIIKHCGLVSGESVLGTGFISEFSASVSDLFGSASNTFASKMNEAKNIAKRHLIENALKVGANALIGVDFDYITFGNNMIGVSANATAVVVEKIEKL